MKYLLMILWILPIYGNVLFVSDRLDFTDPDEMSSATEKRQAFATPLSLSVPITEREWEQAVSGKRVAVFIHGYNSEYHAASNFFSKMIQNSGHLYETIICYFWPGGNHALEYLEARFRVMDYLPQRFLETMQDLHRTAKSVDIIAYSTGCRLALEMLDEPSNVYIQNIFFMAPAVDNEVLEEGERYYESSKKCRTMMVFHSMNDQVLKWGYPLGDFDRALGYSGAENPEDLSSHIFQVNCTDHVDSHGGYASSSFVFDVISQVVR